jgi:hypothetical protein
MSVLFILLRNVEKEKVLSNNIIMNRTALIFMIVSETVITAIMIYFFLKVLFTKPNPETNSYSDNDEVEK